MFIEEASLEFIGMEGISTICVTSIIELIQGGNRISRAFILTHDNNHCLYLEIEPLRAILVKSGFSSGYNGEGPNSFSYVLALLEVHGAEIDEFSVNKKNLTKIDRNELRKHELLSILKSHPIRPLRWHDYKNRDINSNLFSAKHWQRFPLVMPFKIIDAELFDLALSFWEAPSDKLMQGYRRLEDIVRKKSEIDGHGARLFNRAFMGNSSVLYWDEIGESEQIGRANLFIGLYCGYRNPRAHKKLDEL